MFMSYREGPTDTEEKTGWHTPIRLGTALIAAVGLLLGPLAIAASATAAPHATSPVMGSYVSVTPFRITDTRTGSGQPNAGKTLAAAATLNVQVTGLGTVPAGASAAVLNVTAVFPTASGFLTVFPAGITMPTVSSLNFTPGATVANLVTVPLSATGMVSIFNHAGSTNVVVDVEGYYTSTASTDGSGLYNSLSPTRALGTLQHGRGIPANSRLPVVVAGSSASDGVPATATAVVLNATAAFGTASSFLTVYPAGVTMPTASNLNFVASQAVANRVTVGVGVSGQIEVYNHSGTVYVDIDVDGYYTGAGGTGSVFVPITPVRVADTRTASLVGTGTPIAASTSESFNLATSASGIPATATSVAANVTVVAGDAPGYATVYPTSDTTNPVASDVNWVADEIVPNFTIADTAGTGNVEVYNSHGGTINLVIDAFGYFTSSGLTMVSATVTDTTIAITYNEAVSCPSLAGAQADFAYYWTGAASGITSSSAIACVGDVLTLTGVFTLPGSTGGSIVYTTPTTNSSTASVSATGPVYAATQTLALTPPAAPMMVSAYTTATTVVITYNENVTCLGTADAAFAYYYTGVATDAITNAACAANVLTLTVSANDPPGSGASIVYTAPATNTALVSVSATGSVPALYAATQAFVGPWTTPTMVSAVVTATTIAITYNGENLTCPNLAGAQADFVYYSAGTTSGITAVTAAACATDVLTLTGTFALPGTGASIVYTAPASPTTSNAVSATSDFPQFAATQTLALPLGTVPAMVSAVVNVSLLSIAITYNEDVSCPATGADGDFVYDSGFNTLGGAISGCSTAGIVLTLTGVFNAATGSASIVYTAPASSSVANAVYAAGSTGDFAATQTLLPL